MEKCYPLTFSHFPLHKAEDIIKIMFQQDSNSRFLHWWVCEVITIIDRSGGEYRLEACTLMIYVYSVLFLVQVIFDAMCPTPKM